MCRAYPVQWVIFASPRPAFLREMWLVDCSCTLTTYMHNPYTLRLQTYHVPRHAVLPHHSPGCLQMLLQEAHGVRGEHIPLSLIVLPRFMEVACLPHQLNGSLLPPLLCQWGFGSGLGSLSDVVRCRVWTFLCRDKAEGIINPEMLKKRNGTVKTTWEMDLTL